MRPFFGNKEQLPESFSVVYCIAKNKSLKKIRESRVEFWEKNKTVSHVLLECDRFIGLRAKIIDTFREHNHTFCLENILAVKPPNELRLPILKFINELLDDI